jgi:hypothetical protein
MVEVCKAWFLKAARADQNISFEKRPPTAKGTAKVHEGRDSEAEADTRDNEGSFPLACRAGRAVRLSVLP